MAGKKVDIGRVFHALGDPTWRRMVEALSEGPISVSQLAQPFAMSLAAVVQHLQILEECGLVRTEKTGRIRTCRLDSKALAAAEKWLSQRRELWDRRLDGLGELLAEED